MSQYRDAWIAENGYGGLTDHGIDFWEEQKRLRAEEEAAWTPYFFRRMFGVKTARTGQAARKLDKETVRERCSVLALLSSRGIDHRVLGGAALFRCPFHQDKNPSASFSLKKKLWYCHPCVEGGDVFSFVQKLDGCSFVEALEVINRTT